MKTVTSSRRQLVMAVLLALAMLGAAMRHWADNPSLARDVGTLLLVLWLPAVGNLVAFLIARLPARSRAAATGFADGQPFTPQLRAAFTAIDGDPHRSVDPQRTDWTLVVGGEGFTARTAQPLSRTLTAAPAGAIDLELLRPALAMPRLVPGAAFVVLAGTTPVARGQVLTTAP
ncbi:MAG TPA: hypothetical protein VLI46_06925 [Ramlibacter sp.]|nr:hypothetical protein [Ramlibacter sp.]